MTEWIFAIVLLTILVTASARTMSVVAKDGHGLRPVPPPTPDWSALGLPSRPYGT